jgi:hypothetical protein
LLISLALLALVACGSQSSTPTPSFARYTADEVIAALQPLGISDVRAGTSGPDSLVPYIHADNKEFTIDAIAPQGGRVLIFETVNDLAGAQTWYARFPDLAPYVYVKGNALVQLNNTLPKAEAEKYRAAVEGLP